MLSNSTAGAPSGWWSISVMRPMFSCQSTPSSTFSSPRSSAMTSQSRRSSWGRPVERSRSASAARSAGDSGSPSSEPTCTPSSCPTGRFAWVWFSSAIIRNASPCVPPATVREDVTAYWLRAPDGTLNYTYTGRSTFVEAVSVVVCSGSAPSRGVSGRSGRGGWIGRRMGGLATRGVAEKPRREPVLPGHPIVDEPHAREADHAVALVPALDRRPVPHGDDDVQRLEPIEGRSYVGAVGHPRPPLDPVAHRDHMVG